MTWPSTATTAGRSCACRVLAASGRARSLCSAAIAAGRAAFGTRSTGHRAEPGVAPDRPLRPVARREVPSAGSSELGVPRQRRTVEEEIAEVVREHGWYAASISDHQPPFLY